MFSLYKNKKFNFQCPMCSKSYGIEFNPSDVTEFNYEYLDGMGLVGREKCGFCKIEFTIVLSKEGELKAIDEKWAKTESEHYKQLEPIEDEIFMIEDKLIDDKDNEKLNEKLMQLETKKAKIEEAFEKKEEKYYDRQTNWEIKWQEKSYRM